MNYQDTLDELNITLGDSEDVTFTPEEKARALQKAWKDSYVTKPIWDNTLVFSSSSYSYPKPAGVQVVKDIYTQTSSDQFPAPISNELWSVEGDNIQLSTRAKYTFNQGQNLIVKGTTKYDYTTDTITDDTLQEYVIALAGVNTLALLGYKKANLFLKNDTSMAELVTLRRELQNEVRELRTRLAKEYESA